jgi:hypothetical protein
MEIAKEVMGKTTTKLRHDWITFMAKRKGKLTPR